MTNPYIHCPFCCENIDTLCDAKHEYFGITEIVFVYECPNCKNSYILIAEDLNGLAHGGHCLKYSEPCDMEGNG